MSRNLELDIKCRYISKGTREEDGRELVLIAMDVKEIGGENRKATVYLGKSENNQEHYIMKGHLHLKPFNGKLAADAACQKAIKNIHNMNKGEVFEALATM